MSAKTQELRRLMKQQKTSSSKKIKHPLAKYNQLDQLTCAICGTVIKNEIIWNAHLQSKKHKENVNSLKTKANNPIPMKADFKRPIADKTQGSSEPSVKKANNSLPANFFDSPISSKSIVNNEAKPKSILKNRDEPATVMKLETPKGTLPADFFDKGLKPQEETTTSKDGNEDTTDAVKTKKLSTSEALPEGFFDDPKKDAKARNVEYVDPQDKEWEEFQKMIQEETKVAETIREEEDEESEMLKDMTEYNNMKACLSRVQQLKALVRNKSRESKQTLSETREESAATENEDKQNNEESDEDIDDLFNWRAKMA